MSNLLAQLLQDVKDGENTGLGKTAAAPNEPPTPEQQNADILETSQAMMAKIDNFIQQSQGMGQDSSMDPQATGGGNASPMTSGDPNDQSGAGSSTVKLEVPAGMSVKLASINPVDSNSALRTIVGLVPTYFEA
jgi:hypothetical protein